MDRRRTAGALLALAACIACANAAPRYSESTALDLHDEGPKPDGCYYNFQHYGEGDRIMTNEPCLNCTCHNQMLMCYLRVCPFTKPIGKECTLETRADLCCPIITCSDVPVDLLTSTESTAAAEYGMTGVGYLDKYGCNINGKFLPEGAKVPPTPNKPCEHCYCIRNMTTCVMQECTLHVDGCTPIYHKDVCCPVRYSCDHDEDMPLQLDDMSTTEGTTPGIQWTTTVAPSIMQECAHGNETFPDGASIKTEKPCEHCYCMKGDIVCVVQACGTPMEMEGKNCTPVSPPEGQCCPVTYMCEDDNEFATTELFTEPPTKPTDYARAENKNQTTPLDITEGSGFSETTDERTTEVITHTTEADKEIRETTLSAVDLHETTLTPIEKESYTTITDHDDLSPVVTEKHDIAVETTTIYSEKTSIHDLEENPTYAPEPSLSHDTSSTEHPHITDSHHTTNEPIEHDVLTSTPADEKESHVSEFEDITNKDDEFKQSTTALDSDAFESTDKPTYPIFNKEKEDEATETSIIPSTDMPQIITTVPQEKITIEHATTDDILLVPTDVENEEVTTSKISDQDSEHQTTPSIKDYDQETSLPDANESQESSTLSSTDKDVTLDLTTIPNKDIDNIITSSPSVAEDSSTDAGQVYEKEYSTTPVIEVDELTDSSEGPNKINTIPIETVSDNTSSTSPTIVSEVTDESDKTTTQASSVPDIDTKINIENNTDLMEHHTTEGVIDKMQPKPDSSPVVDDNAATTIVPNIDDMNNKLTTITDEDYQSTMKPKEEEYTADIQTFEPSSSTEEPDKGLNTVPDEEDSFSTQPSFIKHSTDYHHIEDVAQTTITVTKKEFEITTESDVHSHTEKEAIETVIDDNSDNKVHVTTESVTLPVSDVATTTTPSLSIEGDMITTPDQDEKKTPEQKLTTLTPDKVDTETPIDVVENEIPEENISPITSPGIIPGEGSCLVDGVTFSNNTIVPSSNKCQTACKCMSSIVKCDTINCSPPPDNMINCQPIYDTPESCCPSYICEDSKETIPPQPESHMTENITKEPQRKCSGTECKLEEDIVPVTSYDLCTSDKCVSQNTQAPSTHTDVLGDCATEGCTPGTGESSTTLPPISKDKTCADGMDCTEAVPSEDCVGESCVVKTDETSPTERHPSSDDSFEYTTQNIIKETTILEEKTTQKESTIEDDESYKTPVDHTEFVESPTTSELAVNEETPHLHTTESLPSESKPETDEQSNIENDTTPRPLDKFTEAHEFVTEDISYSDKTTEKQDTTKEKDDATTPLYVELEEHSHDDVTEPPYHATESDKVIDVSTIKSPGDENIDTKLSTTIPASDITEQIDDDLNTIIPAHEKPMRPTEAVGEETSNKPTDMPGLFTESDIIEGTTSKLYTGEVTTISEIEKDESSTHEPMRTSDKLSPEEDIYKADHETTTLADNADIHKTIKDKTVQEEITTPVLNLDHDLTSTHKPLIDSIDEEPTTSKDYVDHTMTGEPHVDYSTLEPITSSVDERGTTPKDYIDHETMTGEPHVESSSHEPVTSSVDEEGTTPKEYLDHEIMTEEPHVDLSSHEPVTSSVDEEGTTPKGYIDHEIMTEEPHVDLSSHEPVTSSVDEEGTTPKEYLDHEIMTEEPHVDLSSHEPVTSSIVEEGTTPKDNVEHETITEGPHVDLSSQEPITISVDEKATTLKDYVDHDTMTEEPHVDLSTEEPVAISVDETTPKDYIDHETMTEGTHVDLSSHEPVTSNTVEEGTTPKDYVDHDTITEEPHVDLSTFEPITSSLDEKTTTPKDYVDHQTMTEEPHDVLSSHEPMTSVVEEKVTTPKDYLDLETMTEGSHVDLSSHEPVTNNVVDEATTTKDYIDHETTEEPHVTIVDEKATTPKDDVYHETITEEPQFDLSTHEPATISVDEKATTPKDYVDRDTMAEGPHVDLSTQEPITITVGEKETTPKDYVDHDTMTEGPHVDISTQESITVTVDEKETTPKDYVDHDTMTERPHVDLSTQEFITVSVDEKATTPKDYVDHVIMTEEPHVDLSTEEPITVSVDEKVTTLKDNVDHEIMTEGPHVYLSTEESITVSVDEKETTPKDYLDHETMTEGPHVDLSTEESITVSVDEKETTPKDYVDHETMTDGPHVDLSTEEPITVSVDEKATTPKDYVDHETMTEGTHVDLTTQEPITMSVDEKATTLKDNIDHDIMTKEPHVELTTQEPVTVSMDEKATTMKEYVDHEIMTEGPHVDLSTEEPVTVSVDEQGTTPKDYVDHETMTDGLHVDLSTEEPITVSVDEKATTPKDNVDHEIMTEEPHVDLSTQEPVTVSVDEQGTSPKDYVDHEIMTEGPQVDVSTREPITISEHEAAITSKPYVDTDTTILDEGITQKPYIDHETISSENLATDKPVTEKLDHHELTTAEIASDETSSHIPTILESDHKDVTSHEDVTTPKLYSEIQTDEAIHEDLTTPKLIHEISTESSLHETDTEINRETSTHKILTGDDHSKVPLTTETPISSEDTSETETHHSIGYDTTSEPSKITLSSSEHTFESSEIPEPVSSEDGDSHSSEAFPTSGYGPEPDYGDDDQSFGPGTCRYGGKVYVSAQQIPRDDPCDFCFCFRSDIICLQQSCPPPIHGCHEEPIQGFCCPRYECPVSMATSLNVTTTTTTTTTTLPPHFLPHAYNGAAQKKGCQIKGHSYQVGEVVKTSSGPCLHCTCGGDGQMKCDPKVCTPEPMLRQMIAAAVSSKRRR